MIRIVTVQEMQAIETAADAAGVSYGQMMENAGRAIADRVKQIIEELEIADARVAVLVGPGNNGGDGLVTARLIAGETNASVQIFLTRPRDDENLTKAKAAHTLIIDAETDAQRGYRVLRTMVANADVVIDALLGTGTTLPIRGEVETVLRQVHQALSDREADRPAPRLVSPSRPAVRRRSGPVIVAVDVPTGLDSDTGALDDNTLTAHETITFEAAKPGLVTPGAADAIGVLHVAALGLPDRLPARDDVRRTLIDAAVVRRRLPKRPASANKGTFGKALIVAGSANYTGAPALAGQSAYAVGTGLVSIAAPSTIIPIVGVQQLETTYLLLPHDLGALNAEAASIVRSEMKNYSTLLVGPGLGQDEVTGAFIEALFGKAGARGGRKIGFVPSSEEVTQASADEWLPPLVVDADGLNLLAKMESWWTLLPPRTILTPHPGEMARLAKIEAEGDRKPTEVVIANRLTLAADKAAAWKCVVVLKSAFTVIADPDGRLAVVPFATPALARAGTGDVLAGAITGLLAQGLDPFDAAVAAAYLHGYAGELAAEAVGTTASIVASDVIAALPRAIATVEASV
ncbi:MAG TPA: NAD(P)H-hydrate dehydratase [Aggregatilineales bacterium]|nr:NAD(P)H-hydrate dehydratase [Aggregatilineales bacterium]